MDFDPNADYYKALGVAKGASQDEIKKAFREKGLILKSCTDLFIGWYTVEWRSG